MSADCIQDSAIADVHPEDHDEEDEADEEDGDQEDGDHAAMVRRRRQKEWQSFLPSTTSESLTE